MKKAPANMASYKAGAKAQENTRQQKATNPHLPHSAESHTWEHGYLDRQKLQANRNGDLSRRRATLHLPKIKD